VLDDWHRHAKHVQLLERIGAHQCRRHLAGDDHHRHRVQHRIGDAGDQVGSARAGGGHAYADAPAGPRIPVRRERRTLRARYRLVDLTTGQTVLDATAGSDAGIDVVSSEYATIAAEQTALENLTREVADMIVTNVARKMRGSPPLPAG